MISTLEKLENWVGEHEIIDFHKEEEKGWPVQAYLIKFKLNRKFPPCPNQQEH